MTTPSATPRRRRRLAIVGALIGAVVSLGAITDAASAAPGGKIVRYVDEEPAAAKSGIRW